MKARRTVGAALVLVAALPVAAHADAGAAWAELVAGNQRFASGTTRPRALVAARERLVAGENPRAVVVGCSDSRVSPEILFDQELGDLFVVRTSGHVVDAWAQASIDRAVGALGVGLIVVLGHDGCERASDAEAAVTRTALEVGGGSAVVRTALAAGKLSIVRAVYDLSTGLVRRIP